MVSAVGIGSHGSSFAATALAILAVSVGMVFRQVATLAVLLTVLVIVLSNPAPTLAAGSGLSAVAYLVVRHAAGSGAGFATVSGSTMVGAVGFTFAGLAATVFPLQLPWLPLVAPLAVLAVYVVATRPFLCDENFPR
ncbi:MAG: hypothetical protein J2P17_27335 [Mycobacterium sp.]|nr:hypothetical protein [Mycobacterium sp.]